MKFILCLTVFSLAIAVMCAEHEDDLSPEKALTVDDFLEYFEMEDIPTEKRGSKNKAKKLGPCTNPAGKTCQLCNFRIKDRYDIRRYVLCSGTTRKI